MVASVEPGGPSQRGGIAAGDTLVALDGQAVNDLDRLLEALGGDRIGHVVTLRLVRGGQVRECAVTIGERP
jgi:S1-C subfamily serine protease